MSVFASPRFLPRVMWADAASCAATGALQVAFTDALARLTGLPAPLLLGTGVFLLAYAAMAAFMAGRRTPPRGQFRLGRGLHRAAGERHVRGHCAGHGMGAGAGGLRGRAGRAAMDRPAPHAWQCANGHGLKDRAAHSEKRGRAESPDYSD